MGVGRGGALEYPPQKGTSGWGDTGSMRRPFTTKGDVCFAAQLWAVPCKDRGIRPSCPVPEHTEPKRLQPRCSQTPQARPGPQEVPRAGLARASGRGSCADSGDDDGGDGDHLSPFALLEQSPTAWGFIKNESVSVLEAGRSKAKAGLCRGGLLCSQEDAWLAHLPEGPCAASYTAEGLRGAEKACPASIRPVYKGPSSHSHEWAPWLSHLKAAVGISARTSEGTPALKPWQWRWWDVAGSDDGDGTSHSLCPCTCLGTPVFFFLVPSGKWVLFLLMSLY